MDNNITIVDLARIKSLIDLACERGAFRANEMKTVGETYDRLTAFLESVVSQAKNDQETTTNNAQGETT